MSAALLVGLSLLPVILGVTLQSQLPNLPGGFPPGGILSSGDVPGSPSVLVSRIGRVTADGPIVDLLVLWRGTDGWYLDQPRRQSAGERGGVYYQHRESGAVRLELSFDRGAQTVSVQGRPPIKLKNAPTVLIVDAVTDNKGPRSVEEVALNTQPTWTLGTMELLRSSEELKKLLRCEEYIGIGKQRGLSGACAPARR